MTANVWIVRIKLSFILIINLSSSNQTASVSWQDKIRQRAPDFSKCPKKFGFDRPLLMVHSFDGFGARFVDRVPSMKSLSEQALRAKHMRPVFPTSTFPNHYAIVTGLYAESHGIIDQSFPSADNKTLFVNSKPSHFISDFWKGEPIWQVAQRQGKKVFVRYWVGSDVVINGVQPANWTTYTDFESVETRINTIIGWIKLPKGQRPDMTLSYLQEPDAGGHASLETSGRFKDGLQQVDHFLGLMMTRLTEAGLTDCVDLIILSDHGIDECRHTVDPHVERAEPVDIDRGKQGTINRVKLSKHADIDEAASLLTCDSENSPYQVYTKQKLPVRLHYANADIIPPIIIMPNLSYILYPKESNQTCAGKFTIHGWDNIYRTMQALFIAYGPSFKVKDTVEPFENVELFGLFCDLLNISCIPTNGTAGSLRHLLRAEKQKSLSRPEDGFGDISSVTKSFKFGSNGRSDVICPDNCSQKADFGALEQVARSSSQNRSEMVGLPRVSPSGARHMDINILLNHDYKAGYDSKHQMASWIKFGLPRRPGVQLKQKLKDSKANCRFADPRINVKPTWTLPCAGKTGNSSKLVFAPMYPPELTSKPEYQAEPLLITNMVPMYATFYNGYWKALLRLVVSWNTVSNPLTLYVGPAWDREAPFGAADSFHAAKVDSGKSIPTHFYLIAVKQRDKPSCQDLSCSLDVISFILPHQPKPQKPCQSDRLYLLTNTASVKNVERITGLRFFPDLPWQEAVRLRTRLADNLWDDRIPL